MKKKQLILVSLILMAVLGMSVLMASGPAATPQPPLTVTLKAGDIMFDNTAITAKLGQPITLTLENTGALAHSFVIDALSIKIENVQPGQTSSVTFTPAAAGTYDFYCDIAGHKEAGMKGKLTVTP